jgi:hypothetical protein
MPELIAFIACDKVLMDEQRNPTLVVLIENIEAGVLEGAAIPEQLMAPKEWAIFTLWKRSEQEQGKHYKQISVLTAARNSNRMQVELEFNFDEILHRTISRIVGFPVGTVGTALLETWLEENGSPVTEKISYPIKVSHNIVPRPKGQNADQATTKTQ